jgi:hypothetical protein
MLMRPRRRPPAWLRARWRRWGWRPGDVDGRVVAAAGVWTAAERRAAAARLRGLARRAAVVADVEAAYAGALGAGPGVLVLAGTGAMALGRDGRGRWRRAGGLGPLLGDEGSAFWIGREWLRLAARSDLAAVRRVLAAPDPVASIAALAPGVLRQGRRPGPRRRPARRVVVAAQAALAGLLGDVARGLGLRRPVAVSWAGGLMADAPFRAGIWRAARRAGLPVTPRAPREPAVAAAARLAARPAPGRGTPS